MVGSPRSVATPIDGKPGLLWVAWHQGGAQTLRIGRRHITTTDANEGRAVRVTLCGRRWRRSQEVPPTDYWTTGDCALCSMKAGLDSAG